MSANYRPQELEDGKFVYVRDEHGVGVFRAGGCAENCKGHNTKEEAFNHFRSHLLDNSLSFLGEVTANNDKTCRAEGCSVKAEGIAVFGAGLPRFHLCKEHQTKAVVAKLFPAMKVPVVEEVPEPPAA